MNNTVKRLSLLLRGCCLFFSLLVLSGFSWHLLIGTLSWEKIFQYIESSYPQVRHLNSQELTTRLAVESLLLLDIRSKEEFEVSHIPGAQLGSEVDVEDVPYNTLIVAYCSVGIRSAQKVSDLQEQGFVHVYNLSGGLFQWANNDLALESNGAQALTVHPYSDRWGKLLKPEMHWQPE